MTQYLGTDEEQDKIYYKLGRLSNQYSDMSSLLTIVIANLDDRIKNPDQCVSNQTDCVQHN